MDVTKYSYIPFAQLLVNQHLPALCTWGLCSHGN